MSKGYNGSSIMNFKKDDALKMFDKLSGIPDGRRVQPLDPLDNIFYPHRYLYSDYNLQIGDTYFMVPPEFILVNSQSQSQSVVTLRQENSSKEKPGYRRRTILIDLVFNGIEQINGYPVDGPEGTYYVDGLRQLLAQFKCTPFLPIQNETINGTFGIFAVVLQSITFQTITGFPDMMTAQITLQETCMFPYIEMPDACFKYMIDWDLFRFYYQQFLTENHVYKKLQSISANHEHNRFKISILDENVFQDTSKVSEKNFLQIVTDSNNFITWLDSDTDDCYITEFRCGYQNIITNLQLSDCGTPTTQYMGGMDTIFDIVFETRDYQVVQALDQCQISNDCLVRNNGQIRSLGFVKLESELVEFTGSLFVVVESLTVNTVPGFPGLYNVHLQCVAYDIAQSERENLNGFKPFADDSNLEEQCITQTMEGLKTKVKQDNYAEWKLRNTMEVYPDLRLPTYQEVDEFIGYCNGFRRANGLSPLPYTKYPRNNLVMLHGQNPNNGIKVKKLNGYAKSAADLKISGKAYEGYVDPDFYVFYPFSYVSFNEDKDAYASYAGITRSSYTKTKTYSTQPWADEDFTTGQDTPSGSGTPNSNKIEEFMSIIQAQEGCKYRMVTEAYGPLKDSNGKYIFDCSGLMTFGLMQCGLMDTGATRMTVSEIANGSYNNILTKVDKNDMKRGDLLLNYGGGSHHVVAYEGDYKITHASSKAGKVVVHDKLYFTPTHVYRPKGFEQSSYSVSDEGDSSTLEGRQEIIWNVLKSLGYNDYAAAGVIGCWTAESSCSPKRIEGDYISSFTGYDMINNRSTMNSWTQTLFNAYASKGMGINRGAYKGTDGNYYPGIGLAQWTGPRGQNFLNFAGDQWDKLDKQTEWVVQELNSGYTKANNLLKSATSARQAASDFCKYYEGYSGSSASRQAEAEKVYDRLKGTAGTPPSDSTDVSSTSQYNLTNTEFENICRAIMGVTEGRNKHVKLEKALAQTIYDKITDTNMGLSTVLSDNSLFPKSWTGDISDSVKRIVENTFCNGNRYWEDWTVKTFMTTDNANISTYKNNDMIYDRLEDIGTVTFWGNESLPSKTVQYTISDTNGTGEASSNGQTINTDVPHNAVDADPNHFGSPVLLRTDAIMYNDSFMSWMADPKRKTNSSKMDDGVNVLNDDELIFSSSFVDDCQYSHRGTLLRAFPAYLFCILDDQAQWYRGNKLWTNYYTHKSVVDIQVHGTNDMPMETATIVVNNIYHNLDRTQGGLSSYSLKNDPDYARWQRNWYEWTGMMPGLGPKLTSTLIELHSIIYDHALLRDGARVHLRMGYGSDPLSLAPVINGFLSDVQLGNQISLVISSDGAELVQHITSSNEKDINNGWFGLFGLGEHQESSDIVADILCERQSWFNYIAGSTFEGSKYSIEHFGLFFNQSIMGAITAISTGVAVASGVASGSMVGAAAGSAVPILGNIIGFVAGAAIGAAAGLATSVLLDNNIDIRDLWDGYTEQYDICKNIYKANYKKEHYIYATFADLFDEEDNVVFNQYNMTPWDVFQMCTQNVPEYIVKPTYHQFDSRLYFGLPFLMEKYRYNYLGGVVYEEAKSACQVHVVDSLCSIIDNQVKVTSRYSNTNCKVIYTRGKSLTSTKIIHSDDSIDFSRQKTTIIDSSITQDALGPDAIYEFLEYDIGKENARRLGISNLLYGWQQQYQGPILCLGLPGVKAHDYLMVNDSYSSLYGVCLCREVVQSFNTNTGYTTSIIPGMIGFCTDEQSGMIEATENYLSLLNHFSNFMEVRRLIRNNSDLHMSTIIEMELLRNNYVSVAKQQGIIKNIQIGFNVLSGVINIGGTTCATVKVCKKLYNIHKAASIVKTAVTAFTTAAKAVEAAGTITKGIAAIRAGTLAAAGVLAPESFGLSYVVVAIVWAVVDLLLRDLLEWLSNKNVCVLLPMFWNGYPFIAGVKDGEKISLIPMNSNGTDENTRADSIQEYD